MLGVDPVLAAYQPELELLGHAKLFTNKKERLLLYSSVIGCNYLKYL